MKNRRGKPCPRPKKRESGIIQKSWLLYDWINDHFLWLLKNQCMKTHLRRAPLHITNPPLRPDAPPHAVGMKRISFNAGELSPELFQSADLNAFHRGASTLVNRNASQMDSLRRRRGMAPFAEAGDHSRLAPTSTPIPATSASSWKSQGMSCTSSLRIPAKNSWRNSPTRPTNSTSTPGLKKGGKLPSHRNMTPTATRYSSRPQRIQCASRDGNTVVECCYDYQGRRYMKKVTVNGTVTSHERYLYRGYLQLAALDMLNRRNVLRTLLWDPLEPMATRPLALVQDNALYCYGVDFNKNVTEVFDAQGTIAAAYDYSLYGHVASTGDLVQPVQWSSEMNDAELALVYYNYRYYNPVDGRWINRDPIAEEGGWNLYGFVKNDAISKNDLLGMAVTTLDTPAGIQAIINLAKVTGAGVVAGITANQLNNECTIVHQVTDPPVLFNVECEQECSRQKWYYLPCFNKEGTGFRMGRMVCTQGLFKKYWKFIGWEGAPYGCSAAGQCGSCCDNGTVTYEDKL